jgi:glycosyltransferase involved in cell wall biosynthesis
MSFAHGRVTARLTGRRPPVEIVHIVAAEGHKDLIGPQVVDPLAYQADALGARDPGQRMVLLLEAGRTAFSRTIRERVAGLRARGNGAIVAAYPLVGRLGVRANAAALGRWLRATTRGQPRIFHCRGENAVEWAAALTRYFPHTGIVADIRGAWPEEALHALGYDGPDNAPAGEVRRYHVHLSRLQAALACAGSVVTVSRGMVDWLIQVGVRRDRLSYVPCGVSAVRYDESARKDVRARLGLEGKVVYAYAGILASYHSVSAGLVRFFREVAQRHSEAHLLALTPDPSRLSELLREAGVSPHRTTVLHAAHSEVSQLLIGADCGLILMRPCRLAPTWQPIKFAEYLASGLPVVVSRGVGRVDAMVEESGAGVVVDVFGSDADFMGSVEATHNELLRRGPEMRANAIALCEREFLWHRYVSTWRDAYHRAVDWASASSTPNRVCFGV